MRPAALHASSSIFGPYARHLNPHTMAPRVPSYVPHVLFPPFMHCLPSSRSSSVVCFAPWPLTLSLPFTHCHRPSHVLSALCTFSSSSVRQLKPSRALTTPQTRDPHPCTIAPYARRLCFYLSPPLARWPRSSHTLACPTPFVHRLRPSRSLGPLRAVECSKPGRPCPGNED
jgi:hypothetical protein